MNLKKKSAKNEFNFIDLFAGIGGFHQAMRFLGGKCVLASEIDSKCRETYSLNFPKTKLIGDIRKHNPCNVEDFTVLCAGFPCQPFSKAGSQKGFEDERGDLFYETLSFIDHNPQIKFLLFENVRNLADKEENWESVKCELKSRGFCITEEPLILSPTHFGIPQIRERVFILGIKCDIVDPGKISDGKIQLKDLNIGGHRKKCVVGDALKILDQSVPDKYLLNQETVDVLDAWEEFRTKLQFKKMGAPVWICAFGLGIEGDEEYKIKAEYHSMPVWKQKFYDKNRQLYLNNKEFIDKWVDKNDMLNKTKLFQKFEWNCGDDDITMKETIIQIRQSGVRFKRLDYFPSLVAMSNTPIVWDKVVRKYRMITPHEASRLQSFHGRYKFDGDDSTIYRQLGNSVNVRILKILGKSLFELEKKS